MISRSEIAETVTGGVVLAVAVGFLIYAGGAIGWFGGGDATQSYRVSLVSAKGINVGSDVRVAGVKVGRVSWLALNPETFSAETELTVDPTYAFPEDSLAVVASEGLLGGNYVEIIPGDSSFPLSSGGRFRTGSRDETLMDFLLDQLGRQ
ncbi:MAG: MlaD family protein [Pseudomonadota bacterium]|nr:MlaD family protein [Pseudomonadota bacterium]